MTGLVQGIL